MKCGHLFNGIGGFALAAHWMGWENIMHCEIDPFCNKVMKKHFPNSYEHTDIRTTDFTIWRGKLDLLTGGEPCQPHSIAGKRKGEKDQRYLWPEYKRAIIEIQPKWIVNENVPGSISNGTLDKKIGDLEAIGYSWWPPFIIPAGAAGALHKRNRVWLVAYTTGNRLERDLCEVVPQKVFDLPPEALVSWESSSDQFKKWEKLMAAPGVLGISDGFPGRMDRIKSIGNSVLPQVAFEIFKAIEAHESTSLPR